MTVRRDHTDVPSAESSDAILSALLDGEASEFEVRRLLRALPDEPGLTDKWSRYSLASSALQGEPFRRASAGFSQRVSDAIAAEEPAGRPSASAGTGQPAWTLLTARLGVAASVAVAVFLGMQLSMDRQSSESPLMAGAPVKQERTASMAVDLEAQRRLNEYIRSVAISPANARTGDSPADLNILDQSPQLRPVSDLELRAPRGSTPE